jgi:hypothetical protein
VGGLEAGREGEGRGTRKRWAAGVKEEEYACNNPYQLFRVKVSSEVDNTKPALA